MQHYQLPQEKVKHFVVVIGTIFLLTINMCDRGRTITHLQIPRFHTQVWYKDTDPYTQTTLAYRDDIPACRVKAYFRKAKWQNKILVFDISFGFLDSRPPINRVT